MPTLIFYDVEISATTTDLDLGTVAPASSDDTELRVYNASGSYQANDVTVSLDGSNATDLYLSLDGDVFTAVVEVGDIAPGSFSSPFWLRRVTEQLASVGPAVATLLATPSGWSTTDDTSISDNIPLDTED